MAITYPSKLNIYNLRNFFDFRSVSTGQIQPGMLLQFNYRSPAGVHDVKPLIYVLEAEQDRIWGVNLHYKLDLLGKVVDLKKIEVNKGYPTVPVVAQPKIEGDPSKVLPIQINQKHIPSLPEFKEALKDKLPQPVGTTKKVPIQLLEQFTLASPPKELLRNYLYPRMTSLTKLVFKV